MHCTFLPQQKNLGVAGALNLAIQWAHEAGMSWLAAFDHDSVPYPEYQTVMAQSLALLPPSVGVLGCNYEQGIGEIVFRGYPMRQKAPALLEMSTVITSGSIHNIKVFMEIGPFREALFVDHVDHEYCLRARRYGHTIFLVTAPLLGHRIGNVSLHRCLGMTFTTSNHAIFRRYFWWRNFVLVCAEYFAREPRWCIWELISGILSTGQMAILEDNRKRKLGEAMRGIWDGLHGRTETPERFRDSLGLASSSIKESYE